MTLFHGSVILPNIRNTVGYMNKVGGLFLNQWGSMHEPIIK